MGARKRLLVVEDNALNRELIRQLLEDRYDLAFAEDGEQALRMAQAPFDLILLDIALPKIGGEEVIRRLRQTRDARALPIVAVTADAMVGDRERLLALGCNDHVTKPIDEVLLDQALRRLLPE